MGFLSLMQLTYLAWHGSDAFHGWRADDSFQSHDYHWWFICTTNTPPLPLHHHQSIKSSIHPPIHPSLQSIMQHLFHY